MVTSCLPTWPLLLFGVLEPIALIWGYYVAMTDPYRFFADQVPEAVTARPELSPQALAMTLQMGNIFALLSAVAVICCWTSNVSVARWYLIVVALGDLGHIYATSQGMGPAWTDIDTWNDMVWGNVGASAFLHVNRWLTVLNIFGSLRAAPSASIDKQK